MEEPDKEDELDEEVEGDEGQDEAGELVHDVEKTEHNPVRQPLLVVVSAFGLESEEGHEAGVGNAEDAGDVGVANAEHD